MSFLDIVNKVLRKLREDEVSSVAESEYSKLIGEFVNDAKDWMEDIWFWSVYETSISTAITGDSTTTDYDLTGTTDRSFLIRRERDGLPLAFDVTSGDIGGQLHDMSYKDLRYRQAVDGGTSTTTHPDTFAIKPDADGRGYTIELLWPASVARTWETHWYVPQATLEVDSTDDGTNVLLPSNPLIAGALFFALNERGEEMGESGIIAEKRWHRALAAAQELDMQVNKVSDQIDMTNLERLRTNLSEIY